MTETESNKRITVHYAGRVQGVGFRYTVCRIAEPFDVTGYVKNLADGSVELVAEGGHETLSQLHERICQEMKGNISTHQLSESPANGEFQSFGVTY